jgi:hypothetical protein
MGAAQSSLKARGNLLEFFEPFLPDHGTFGIELHEGELLQHQNRKGFLGDKLCRESVEVWSRSKEFQKD